MYYTDSNFLYIRIEIGNRFAFYSSIYATWLRTYRDDVVHNHQRDQREPAVVAGAFHVNYPFRLESGSRNMSWGLIWAVNKSSDH